VLCPAGRYQSSQWQSNCVGCEAGEYQPGSGNMSCITCPAGHFCSKLSTAPVTCKSIALYCSEGPGVVQLAALGSCTLPNIPGSSGTRESQTQCEAGFACMGGTKTECAIDSTYQPVISKPSCLPCSSCPSGTHKTSECTTTTDAICEPCHAGSACLEGEKISCVETSTYQPDASKSSCLACLT